MEPPNSWLEPNSRTHPPKKGTLIPGTDVFFSDKTPILGQGTKTDSYFTSRRGSAFILPTGFNRKSSRCWHPQMQESVCLTPVPKITVAKTVIYFFVLKIFPRPPLLTPDSQGTGVPWDPTLYLPLFIFQRLVRHTREVCKQNFQVLCVLKWPEVHLLFSLILFLKVQTDLTHIRIYLRITVLKWCHSLNS